jgi:hypothetical protein
VCECDMRWAVSAGLVFCASCGFFRTGMDNRIFHISGAARTPYVSFCCEIATNTTTNSTMSSINNQPPMTVTDATFCTKHSRTTILTYKNPYVLLINFVLLLTTHNTLKHEIGLESPNQPCVRNCRRLLVFPHSSFNEG